MRRLPDNLREELREPLGELVDEKQLLEILKEETRIISVGDYVTFTLLKHGIQPFMCIIDYIIKRKEYPNEIKEKIQQFPAKHIKVKNPPAFISDDLWNTIKSIYENKQNIPICLEVEGEEDLATLPAIFLAPEDATIIYGLPNKGVVVVKANEANKQKVKDILDRM